MTPWLINDTPTVVAVAVPFDRPPASKDQWRLSLALYLRALPKDGALDPLTEWLLADWPRALRETLAAVRIEFSRKGKADSVVIDGDRLKAIVSAAKSKAWTASVGNNVSALGAANAFASATLPLRDRTPAGLRSGLTSIRSYPAADVAEDLRGLQARRMQRQILTVRGDRSSADLPLALLLDEEAEAASLEELEWEDPVRKSDKNSLGGPVSDVADRVLHRVGKNPYGTRKGGGTEEADTPRYRLKPDVVKYLEGGKRDGSLRQRFLDVHAFHRRIQPLLPEVAPAPKNATAKAAVAAEVKPECQYDVLERIAILRNYPELLRPLGLVLDIDLTESDVSTKEWARAPRSNTPMFVSAELTWKDASLGLIAAPKKPENWPSPKTLYVLDSGTAEFRAEDPEGCEACAKARRARGLLSGRMLNLRAKDESGRPIWALESIDIDGGAIKTAQMAASRGRQAKPARLVTDAEGGVVAIAGGAEIAFGVSATAAPKSAELQRLLRACLRGQAAAGARDSGGETLGEEGDVDVATAPAGAEFRRALAPGFDGGKWREFCARVYGEPGGERRVAWTFFPAGSSEESDAETVLPAARGRGIALLRKCMGTDLEDLLRRSEELLDRDPKDGAAELCGGDLFFGFVPLLSACNPRAPSVRRWFRLSRRCEKYEGTGVPNTTADAVLRIPITKAEDQSGVAAESPPEGLANEVVFSYEGEPLGASAKADPPKKKADCLAPVWRAPVEVVADAECKDPAMLPSGTPVLPPLRFTPDGSSVYDYAVCCAVVDIAGNHKQLPSGPPDDAATLSTPLLRHDPVLPPVALLDRAPDPAAEPGATLATLVLRDGEGDDARWLIPPRVTQSLAEMHGVLDLLGVARTGGFDEIERDVNGEPASIALPAAPGSASGTAPIYRRACGPASERAPFYYPDPLAAGVLIRLFLLAGDGCRRAAQSVRIPWYPGTSWPKAAAIRVVVVPLPCGTAPENAVDIRWQPMRRTVQVLLAPGFSAELVLSSYLARGECLFDAHAVLSHVRTLLADSTAEARALRATQSAGDAKARLSGASRKAAGAYDRSAHRVEAKVLGLRAELLDEVALIGRRMIESGSVPLATPTTRLLCVHAVSVPLAAPRFEKAHVTRTEVEDAVDGVRIGPADASLSGEMRADDRTTDQVTLRADWLEPTDDPRTQAPGVLRRSEIVAEFPRPRPTSALPYEALDLATHRLGHTKHVVVDYTSVGRSRHAGYFPVGPSGSREIRGDGLRLVVPASARPPAPCPAYVVPALEWEAAEEALPFPPLRRFRSTRSGRRLCIYLHRGWFASGEGEMLAVVCADAKSSALVKSHASRWAADPLTGEVTAEPYFGIESIATPEWRGRVRLAESAAAGGKEEAEVAAFRPVFDAERGLWRVEVGLDRTPEPYGSFVRLSIARMQPSCLPFLELSRTEWADYVQLQPDRSLCVLRDPDDATHHTLLVHVFGKGRPAGDGSVRTAFNVGVHVPARIGGLDAGWTLAPDDVAQAAQIPPVSGALHSARLRFRNFQRPCRLLVTEHETWPSTREDTVERVVYFDALEL